MGIGLAKKYGDRFRLIPDIVLANTKLGIKISWLGVYFWYTIK